MTAGPGARTADGGWAARVARRATVLGPIRCPVCGRWSVAVRFGANLRETGRCVWCRSTNRNRQLAWVLCGAIGASGSPRARSLAELDPQLSVRIYATEARGVIHTRLQRLPGYVASEYLGTEHASGTMVGGVRHEDLQQLSFADESFDVVITSDVMEHVPEPYRAHEEILRILRPGGRHVFTVPFGMDRARDRIRAVVTAGGDVEHLLPPEYHGDPLRAEGVLVFTDFGLEMLVRLDELGFDARYHVVAAPRMGCVGQLPIVFEAVKRP